MISSILKYFCLCGSIDKVTAKLTNGSIKMGPLIRLPLSDFPLCDVHAHNVGHWRLDRHRIRRADELPHRRR